MGKGTGKKARKYAVIRAPTFATTFADATVVKESYGWRSRARAVVKEAKCNNR
jgi:hypothetical protein